MEFKGKTALITGASAGIGKAFAEALAAEGADLILVARTQAKLDALATRLSATGIRAESIAADLSKEFAAKEVRQQVEALGMQVDILINNAGFGTHGPFAVAEADAEHREIMLNVTALVDFCHEFVRPMTMRKDGGIINVASTAAFQPLPNMAVYGATKAFVLSFSEALHHECKSSNVNVLALCPGATASDFFTTMGTTEPAFGTPASVEGVVKDGLKALRRGRAVKVSGLRNAIVAQSPRVSPRAAVRRIAARTMGHRG